MFLKSAIAALLATTAVASASAAQTLDFTGYSVVVYDVTTVLGQATAFQGNGSTGFSWTVPTAVRVSAQASFAMETFALPGFYITVKPGYTVSEVSLFAGDFTYSEHDGPRGQARVIPELYFETWVNDVLEQQASGSLDQTQTIGDGSSETRGGYFSVHLPLQVGHFDRFAFDSAGLILRANANQAISASVGSDGQAQLRVTLNMTPVPQPVPEPQTLALFVAGLATLGAMARRRQRG